MSWKFQTTRTPSNPSTPLPANGASSPSSKATGASMSRPGVANERSALARLASASGHSLRLLRLTWASAGIAPCMELGEAEELLSRATLPDEYIAAAGSIHLIKAVPVGSAGGTRGGVPIDVFQKLGVGLRDLANALELEEVANDLRVQVEHVRSTAEPAADPEPLIAAVRRTVQAVSITTEANEVLEKSLKDVAGGIRRLADEEEGSTKRVSDMRTRLHAAGELRELELLRRELVTETVEMERVMSERRRALELLETQSRQAQRRAERLLAALADATTAATTDPLTGLGNRRALAEAARNAAASSHATGVVTCDIDRFKSINDSYGHAIGDRVIVHVADVLRGELRGTDQAFRIGGEEFVLLLAECDDAGLRAAAERLRARLEHSAIAIPSREIQVTASFGAALWGGGSAFDDVLGSADEALYQAKKSGRNRVAIAGG